MTERVVITGAARLSKGTSRPFSPQLTTEIVAVRRENDDAGAER